MTQDQWAVYNALLTTETHLDDMPEIMRQIAQNLTETGYELTGAEWSIAADAVQRVVERGTE